MREILFRGKRLDNGEWVIGDLYRQTDYFGEKQTIIFENKGAARFKKNFVDPETVCQYTGLTDKKGENIFEGDIIMDIDYGFMKCVYLHGSFVWFSVEKFFWIELERYTPNEEVIGNIFDNPELLEEKS